IALLIARDGPFPFPNTKFRLREALRAFTARPVLLTSLGYFGHMWELYAMWSWLSIFFSSVLFTKDDSAASQLGSLVTFIVIGIGAIGCWAAGKLAERIGSAQTAMVSMVFSGC